MGQSISFRPNAYIPTAARTGNNAPSILRGSNAFVRGHEDNTYGECYSGSLDLSHDITPAVLTGTLATTNGLEAVVGTGTAFLTDLYPGMRLIVTDSSTIYKITVGEIIDNTHFNAATAVTHGGSGQSAIIPFVMYEIDKKRGYSLWGNVLKSDRGALIGTGLGTFYLDGQPLPGTSMTLSRKAQIAIPDSSGNYLVQQLGFSDGPAGVVATAGTAPTAKTFADTDVNTGTDNINIAAHGYSTGQPVTLANPGTQISIDGTVLSSNRTVYIIRIDANNIKLASNLQNAVAGTVMNITNAGAGTTTVTPVSKHMQAGDRGIRIAKASTKLGTPSFGNPGPVSIVTVAANGAIDIPLPVMDSNGAPNNPHDAYKIYVSLFGADSTESATNAINGPWYGIRTVTAAELSGGTAGGTYKLEYDDAEAFGSDLISFDNDPPPDAVYVGTVAGYPVLVSCQGAPTAAAPLGTSPGPSIVPFKPANLAAAPLVLDSGQRNEVPLSPPETILGMYMAAGRMYLLTANTLQIASFTSDPDFPVATRPFWKSGFRNPYAICFVNGRLYGFTSAGPMRSVTDGEEGSEEHAFAADVEEIMKDWKPEDVFVVHDPQNECVCFINSGIRQNADGYFESDIVPFMLRNERWSMPITITSTVADRLVSGAATVNGHMEFLAGGRDSTAFTGRNSKTFRFDQISGETVNYRYAFQFTDAGSENRPKKVKRPAVRGKITANGTVGIHGCYIDEEINMAGLAAGNAASKTGPIALSASAGDVRYRPAQDVGVEGLMVFALEVTGSYSGVGARDRLDEVTCEVLVQGGRA